MDIEQVKFRGLNDVGEWIYSNNCLTNVARSSEPRNSCSPAGNLSYFWALVNSGTINPATVGRWTGSESKSNKDIYEDDILESKVDFPDMAGMVYFDRELLQWRIKNEAGAGRCFGIPLDACHNSEIVGNVHEVANG